MCAESGLVFIEQAIGKPFSLERPYCHDCFDAYRYILSINERPMVALLVHLYFIYHGLEEFFEVILFQHLLVCVGFIGCGISFHMMTDVIDCIIVETVDAFIIIRDSGDEGMTLTVGEVRHCW